MNSCDDMAFLSGKREAWKRVPGFFRASGRTPLAWRNVTHNKAAMAISVAAIAFAVLIMFMELGFLNGLFDSQTALMRNLRADLVIVSRAMHNLVTNERFDFARLEQAAGFRGVKGAFPVYIETAATYVKHPATGMENAIRVVGFNLDEPVFLHKQINRQLDRLRIPETVLYDVESRKFFGDLKAGVVTELAGRKVTVAGTFSLTTDYYYDGNMVAGEETFFSLFPGQRKEKVMIGLVQLDGSVPARTVLQRLRAAMPDDVEVMTKGQIISREKRAWRKSSPAGYVFGMGVAVGFVIGVIICYQILYTDILDHIRQLATMKALGYHAGDLVGLVLRQGLVLGMLGFVPAVAMTSGLYGVVSGITGIVMRLTIGRVLLVLGLTVAMCIVSGLLAVRKALEADPAELF